MRPIFHSLGLLVQKRLSTGQYSVYGRETADIFFYLLTNDGKQVLAAVGTDHGNAHYSYRSLPEFEAYGSQECTNRKEMICWLEMVMHESKLQASGEVANEIAHLGEPTPDNPDGLYYVDFRCVLDLINFRSTELKIRRFVRPRAFFNLRHCLHDDALPCTMQHVQCILSVQLQM
jgi:hypothetical protein